MPQSVAEASSSFEGTLLAAACICAFQAATMLGSQQHERAFMENGRVRIPCGNGYITLPAMPGIG